MKVAILGPICKDTITVDSVTKTYMGGIPYYAGFALHNLGADVTVFITCCKKDRAWVKKYFGQIKQKFIDAKGTLHFFRKYSSRKPSVCLSVKVEYYSNEITATPMLIKQLKKFDYIILSPLLIGNISVDFFKTVRKKIRKPIVYGNFGMFASAEKGNLVHKNPENFMSAAPWMDYLFLDENEIIFATETSRVGDGVRKLFGLGLQEIIVTHGSYGSKIFTSKNSYKISAFRPKKIIDPTGAGDTYLGAYIAAIEIFKSYESRGRFAAMAATMSIEKRGAFAGTKEEIINRLQKQKNYGNK